MRHAFFLLFSFLDKALFVRAERGLSIPFPTFLGIHLLMTVCVLEQPPLSGSQGLESVPTPKAGEEVRKLATLGVKTKVHIGMLHD